MDRVEYQSLVIQDLINFERKNELNLAPWYQRRSVWSPSQKAYLVNTLFEQKPIPAIYIRHSIDLERGASIKEVVDGQQRTRAILSYCANEFAANHPDIQGKVKFQDLNRNLQHQFLLTSVPVGYLLGATDSDVIDIFGRINSVSKSLNPQEKRNAKFSGDFKQFCLNQATRRLSFWRDYSIFSTTEIARMTEVQFISDVVINLIEGLTDFSPSKIDNYYKNFDDNFPSAGEIQSRLDRIFDFLIDLDPNVITGTVFNRQPLFFSLLIVLDSIQELNKRRIENSLLDIDAIFNDDTPINERPADVISFINSVQATTQRIAQRQTRDAFLRQHLV